MNFDAFKIISGASWPSHGLLVPKSRGTLASFDRILFMIIPHTLLAGLAFSAVAAANLSDLPGEIRKSFVALINPSTLPAYSMTSKENCEWVEAFMLQSHIMRIDQETGQLHPDYSHPCWSADQNWKKKALVQFPVYDNNLKHLYTFGPSFTSNVGRDLNRQDITPLVSRRGFSDLIMRLVSDRSFVLWINEISVILLSSEFTDVQINEVLDRLDKKQTEQDPIFVVHANLVPSMIQGKFKDDDLIESLGEKGHIHICFIHCLVKYKCFAMLNKIMNSQLMIRCFNAPLNQQFTLERLYDGISQMVDEEQKKAILIWLSKNTVDYISNIAKLYLADESGTGLFDASSVIITKYDYHLFNVLFGSSPLGRRFARDMKSDLLTVTTGSKTLLHTLRDSNLSESGYLRLIKGLSQMYTSATNEEKAVFITNATTLLLAFKGLNEDADNRVLVRELIVDSNIPFEIKRQVVPVIGTVQNLYRLPLVQSLMKFGSSAQELMLVLDTVIDLVDAADMWRYLEAIVEHPKFSPMATHIITVHSRKNHCLSSYIEIARNELSSLAFIIRPLFAALGQAIVKNAGGKEYIFNSMIQISPVELTMLLPLLFNGILTDDEMRSLYDGTLKRRPIPDF